MALPESAGGVPVIDHDCTSCAPGCAVRLRRCSRCGLPETYETIEFDDDGGPTKTLSDH